VPIQPLGLWQSAWEAVQYEAPGGIWLGQPLGDQLIYQIIRHKQTLVHQPLCFRSFGSLPLRWIIADRAQDIAGRNLGDAVLRNEQLGLRAFADSGRA
jgi:hypothetical protein